MQNRFRTAIVCFSALLPTCLHAEGIDTEHLFGFMIGSDVGSAGEREFQSQTTGRFSKSGGNYRAISQDLELEIVPVQNFRIEMGSSFASHDINGVPGFEDRRQPQASPGARPMSWPKMLMRPAWMPNSRVISETNVLLPAPLRPSSAVKLARATVKPMSFRARRAP
jgi:hypothetical protein